MSTGNTWEYWTSRKKRESLNLFRRKKYNFIEEKHEDSRSKLYFLRSNHIASKLLAGPFRVNSQEVVRSPSPIFLKFYSNCHYLIWWTSAKFEWNLSRNSMIIKLFSWGCLARREQIVHIWPCLKPYYCQTTLVNNPNFQGC